MEPVQKLVKLSSRMFYEPAHFILLDILLKEDILPEDVIADRLQIQMKQVNKLVIKLRDDGFLQSEGRLEVREYDGKNITRCYWSIDYEDFIEKTRWRIKKMSSKVEELIQKGAKGDSESFVCTLCKKRYDLLDFNRFVH